MKPEKIRRLLADGLEAHRLTRVWRDAYDAAYTDGLILALTNDWVVMHVVADGAYLDDVQMMRLRDISTVIDGHNDYIERAVRGLARPVARVGLHNDATVRDLLLAAADLHPLIAFSLGDEGEEQLMVGRLVEAERHGVRLRFLAPDGTWADEVDRWGYEQISSIQVGGRYLDALARFGDPYPSEPSGTS